MRWSFSCSSHRHHSYVSREPCYCKILETLIPSLNFNLLLFELPLNTIYLWEGGFTTCSRLVILHNTGARVKRWWAGTCTEEKLTCVQKACYYMRHSQWETTNSMVSQAPLLMEKVREANPSAPLCDKWRWHSHKVSALQNFMEPASTKSDKHL